MQDRHIRAWELKYEILENTYNGIHTVLGYERIQDKSGRKNWHIIAECGNCNAEISQRYNVFLSSTCCDNCSRLQGHNYKDGRATESLWRVYRSMLSRCYTPTNHKYYRYGDRGIRVHEAWVKDYSSFKSWAYANGYKDNSAIKDYKDYLAIDRINNGGNYEPINCQWITVSANSIKKRLDTM